MRKIIHVDMDCFYAAVETKYRPELRGKAIAVGGPPQSRSVLLTANYEARKYKVRSAMPSAQAARLCPHLIFVPPHFELYKQESLAVREIFKRFTPLVEPLSLDEAYLDVTGVTHFEGSATRIAAEIRAQIERETGLTASAGVAPNKFLAKIASDWNKPNGQYVIRPSDIDAFMLGLEIEKIHGVGRVTAQKMHGLGLKTCADIQKQSLAQLSQWFGSRAMELSERARGIDHRMVSADRERKSLTVEETYHQDLPAIEDGLKQIPGLYADWSRRMHKAEGTHLIRGLVVKLKFFDFKTTTHEQASKHWPRVEDFTRLLRSAWSRRAAPVRLIGIGVRLGSEKLEPESAQLKFDV